MNVQAYNSLIEQTRSKGARLIAVSKTHPPQAVLEVYNLGQRVFGENKVQELCDKYKQLPKDIEWHLIGHLQTNKVKYIAPFVTLIHSVDSLKLLIEIDRQGAKNKRVIDCLLQLFIADEPTKFGLSPQELKVLLENKALAELKHVRICGLMGMATNTEDTAKINAEFAGLKALFEEVKARYFADAPYFKELSMGMTSDYQIALNNGATLIRVGSAIFGHRSYKV